MNKITTFVSACFRECPFRHRCAIMAMSALLGLMFIVALHTGCASTSAGLNREQGIYRASTNVISGVQSLVPFMPAPVATPVEVILGIASAALGAWNLHQQKSIKALKNGSGKSPPGTLSTRSPQPATNPAQPPAANQT